MNSAGWKTVFERTAAAVTLHESRLSHLDSGIGDGDHGVTMRRGFEAVCVGLEQTAPTSVEGVFASAGAAFSGGVGGVMGPLMGTLFLAMAKEARGVEETSTKTWAAMVASGLARVRAVGRAAPGDKTMVDALAPASAALADAAAHELSFAAAAAAAATAARAGADATAQMVARFGRAKFAGERSLGHQDAGANTVSLFFEIIAEVAKERHDALP